MIHTVTVCAGSSPHSVNAQEHAFRIAGWYQALLRVVGCWDPKDDRKIRAGGEDPERLATQMIASVVERAEALELRTDQGLRANGVVNGLLQESRECDLLVLGLPSETDGDADFVEGIMDADLTVIREARCSLLVCALPLRPVGKILVNYQGGRIGKNALRIAAEIAQHTWAKLEVLAIHQDLTQAEHLSAQAMKYLTAFDLRQKVHSEAEGVPGSEDDILAAAESSEPDLIVIGDPPYGLIDRVLGQDAAEEVALGTFLPVLIAR